MTVLVVGASGATGRLLVQQLLARDHRVRAVVRSAEAFARNVPPCDGLEVTEASVLDLSDADLAELVAGCDAVASCLGHNLTFKGVLGSPRRLVTDAVRRLCDAIRVNDPGRPIRFVLMSSAGVRGPGERVSLAERCVVGLIRLLIPPHADNEQAATYLRTAVGADDAAIQWTAVRPDTLVDADVVSEYELHPSPTRSAIFNPGKTSRINVAHFMAELITDDTKCDEWRGRMPVVYNRT